MMENIVTEKIFKTQSLFPEREAGFIEDFDLIFNQIQIKNVRKLKKTREF